jgi:hypothetical protein
MRVVVVDSFGYYTRNTLRAWGLTRVDKSSSLSWRQKDHLNIIARNRTHAPAEQQECKKKKRANHRAGYFGDLGAS